MTDVLTHAAAFLAGVATAYVMVWRLGLPERRTGGSRMPKRSLRDAPVWVIALCLGGPFLIALGVQQTAYQRSAEENQQRTEAYVSCVDGWARDVTDTLTARTAASAAVTAATTARDEALRELVQTLAELAALPPEAQQTDLSEARAEYAATSTALAELQADAESTRASNPYTPPSCGD